MSKKLLIIIPVYNEEASIEKLIKKMKKHKIDELGDILVINDGSTDGTEKMVKKHAVEILNKSTNMGYGSTLQLGYKYACRNDYEYVIQLDGDGQHSVLNIEVIYNALIGNNSSPKLLPDIVIGSRFLSKENEMKTSFGKNIAITFFKKIIKIVTGETITDPTSGLQGLNKNAFSFYAGYGNFDYRYPDINMIIQMLILGYSIEEIPAKMYPRKYGESMHSGIIKPMKYMIIMLLSTGNVMLRQREAFYNKRKKVAYEDTYNV